MHTEFSENREFTISDIVESINQFVPLAYTNQESIDSLQEWAESGKARLASSKNE